jgi:hypothetical protein
MKSLTELLDEQVRELGKLSFNFLLSVAKTKEPLTYTFNSDGAEHQIEVLISNLDDAQLEMIVAIDSGWKARFDKGSITRTVKIAK